jgi:hypothetical protein
MTLAIKLLEGVRDNDADVADGDKSEVVLA